jgi:pimeloyl-ACP methyl ester carboxylesterase
MKNTCTSIALALLVLAGCADLDANVHNRRHCTVVDENTCNDKEYWDRLCTACDDSYDFNRNYDWHDKTLLDGESVRDIKTILREAQLPTEDGKGTLFAYFIPSHGENPALVDTTIVYNNGNFANIEHYVPRIRFLHEAGYNLLIWDYRGYGKSVPDADCTPDEFLSDARLIWDYAKTQAPDESKMITYGFSLGGIPATEMSLSNEQCALMLEAVFPSISIVAESASTLSFGEGFFSAGKYDNVAKLKRVTTPAFFFHGDLDRKFPLSATQALYDAAATNHKEFWIVPGAYHGLTKGAIPEQGLTQYLDQLQGFLQTHAPDCLSE